MLDLHRRIDGIRERSACPSGRPDNGEQAIDVAARMEGNLPESGDVVLVIVDSHRPGSLPPADDDLPLAKIVQILACRLRGVGPVNLGPVVVEAHLLTPERGLSADTLCRRS